MKLDRSAEYALIASGHIAQKNGELVLAQEVAEKYAIPVEYLHKILELLVRNGILRSKRGPRGGFTLAESPDKISFLQIIEAINGPAHCDAGFKIHAPNEQFTTRMDNVCTTGIEKARHVLATAKLSHVL